MKRHVVVEVMVAAALAAGPGAWSLAAAPKDAGVAVIDVKRVEAEIAAAQAQVVRGELDAGLKALVAVKPRAVTAELAARADFVAKLAEVRMAAKLGDQAKTTAALAGAFARAREPDQVAAAWATGLAVARAAVADGGDAGAVIDFLAKGPGPAMREFGAYIDLARLRIATGNAGAAEAELRRAAGGARTARDWTSWVAGAKQLALIVDGGQAPRAGADVFERLREVVGPATGELDVAKGRFLLARGVLDDLENLSELAVTEAGSGEGALSALSLGYDVAAAYKKAGNDEAARQVFETIDQYARNARAARGGVASIRGAALVALGRAGEAADVLWEAARSAKDPKERGELLEAYGAAMVAAGATSNAADRLRTAKAGPAVYVAVAGAAARAGDAAGAMELLAAVEPRAFAEDLKAAAAVGPLMRQIQALRQGVAKDQGARARAIAAALGAAAKASKDPKAAAELTRQAAALTALAGQVEN